eukprot:177475-Pelagomonas_calceolata.AAC.5
MLGLPVKWYHYTASGNKETKVRQAVLTAPWRGGLYGQALVSEAVPYKCCTPNGCDGQGQPQAAEHKRETIGIFVTIGCGLSGEQACIQGRLAFPSMVETLGLGLACKEGGETDNCYLTCNPTQLAKRFSVGRSQSSAT